MIKVCFITEAGPKFGYGHLMRCRSLALELMKHEMDCSFIINQDDKAKELLGRIKSATYQPGAHLEKDLLSLCQGADIIVVDSYTIPEAMCQRLSSKADLFIAIDDYNRISYPQGLVINCSLLAPDLDYPKLDGVEYLLGPQYCFLREEFKSVKAKNIREDIQKILLVFGGSDVHDMTDKVLKHVLAISGEAVIQVVKIGNDLKITSPRIRHHKDVDASLMKELMMSADLAVTAGGQTTFELARIGTPAIGICMADNQRLNLTGWEKAGFLKIAGDYNDPKLYEQITQAFNDFKPMAARQKSSEAGKSLIDGQGTQRVGQIIQDRLTCKK